MTKHISVAPESPVDDLMTIHRRIAMESNFLANFSTSVASLLPSLTKSSKRFFAGLSFSPVETPNTQERPKFVKLLDKHTFLDVGELSIFVPEGFAGNLVAYSKLLKESAEHSGVVLSDVLTPYNAFLASLINGASLKNTHDVLGYLKQNDASRDHLNSDIGKQFAHRKNSRLPMKACTERLADWDEILEVLRLTKTTIESVDRSKVIKAVAETNDLLDALCASAVEGELDNISSNQIRSLSTSTYSVAMEAEFYAITLNRYNTMQVCVNDTIDFVTNALK